MTYFGTDVLREAIAYSLSLAAHAEQLVRRRPSMEVLAPATLGILCFRVHPRGVDDPAVLDALNERINAGVNAGGRFFISSTRIRGALSLRICPIGFRTTREDMAVFVDEVAALAAPSA